MLQKLRRIHTNFASSEVVDVLFFGTFYLKICNVLLIEPENPHNSNFNMSSNQYPMFTDFFTRSSVNDCKAEFG